MKRTYIMPTTRKVINPEEEVVPGFRSYDRLAPGQYSVYCREIKSAYQDPRLRGRWTVLLVFDVFDTTGFNVIGQARRWLGLGSKEKPDVQRGSDYWAWWIGANGGKGPTRADQMTARIFKGRFARVVIGDSEPPPRRMGPHVPHSIVKSIIEWQTGQGEILGTGADTLFTEKV